MSDATEQPQTTGLREPETDPLAKQWMQRYDAALKHWEKFHKRVRHNRKTVAGFNWTKDPDADDFYTLRANLIQGTITAVLPNIYARNPEISVSPLYKAASFKLFCKTLDTVTNRYLAMARLKDRAKSMVRAALTASFGVVKVMYQRDMKTDPIIQSRINDTQDNINQVQALIDQVNDPAQSADHEAKLEELRQTMEGLKSQSEIVAAEGLVIDRVLTDHLVIDPSVAEFWDYRDAGWIAQMIPMKKADAEAKFGVKLDKAKAYKDAAPGTSDGRLASANKASLDEDRQIIIIEIWDKRSQRIYTLAEGCDFWVREPYTPTKIGERWYPFFLLPYQVVDGQFVAPSLVDLTEKLQTEHNESRDRFNKHRDLAIPGWVAAGETSEQALNNFAKSVSVSGFGEITIVDTDGRPLSQVISPKQHPPVDPSVYDTSQVRYDWEQVTGLQDAARSTVVNPKTATEAGILQQALSGRVAEFRDQVEDCLEEIAQYTAQILVQELSPAQVERIMGPPEEKTVLQNGVPMTASVPSYDWPNLTQENVFEMVSLQIRAGTTGAPDKLQQQQTWTQVLPIIQNLIMEIMKARASGMDAEPFINLLAETFKRFDERLDVESFIPQPPAPAQAMPSLPGLAGAPPGVPGMGAPAPAPMGAMAPAPAAAPTI